ncbi:MAG TPA: ferric reductase-like transmembrane domain-containing protein [Sulfuricurvum sp.]|nr:ferric reductase-like transmembrane domain-containing protein [Sulfuricurvum sp.]
MRIIIWFAALLPAVYALIRFSVEFHPQWMKDIGIFLEPLLHVVLTRKPTDPLKFLSDLSGNSALWLLAVTLLVTLLRSYIGINFLRYRRLLGLFAFFYALIHAFLFIGIDQQFNFMGVNHEVVSKPFIAFGMGAFVILLLMALTSSKKMYAKFKSWHKLVYIAVVLIALHYLMSHKTITLTHIAVVGTLLSLLALRLLKR